MINYTKLTVVLTTETQEKW